MQQVLTLSQIRTRDALEAVSVPLLEKFKTQLAGQIKALVEAEYAKTEFAWIRDPDLNVLDDYLEQALGDCFYGVEQEIES